MICINRNVDSSLESQDDKGKWEGLESVFMHLLEYANNLYVSRVATRFLTLHGDTKELASLDIRICICNHVTPKKMALLGGKI